MKWLIIVLIVIVLLAAVLVIWNRTRRGQIQRDRAQAVELRNGTATAEGSAPIDPSMHEQDQNNTLDDTTPSSAAASSSAAHTGTPAGSTKRPHSGAKHRGIPGPEAKTWAESQARTPRGEQSDSASDSTSETSEATPRTAADFLREAGENPAEVEAGVAAGAEGRTGSQDSHPRGGGRHRA